MTFDGCPRCEKPLRLCVCAGIVPVRTRKRVVILQHPQEPDKELGTARLTTLALENSELRVGLSWPNVRAVAGEDAVPGRWVVLYLGSAEGNRPLTFVDKRGVPLSAQPSADDIDGVVVLDGTWTQAKAIWWRNAWLLKLKRGVLRPDRPSLYGRMRKEPRRECLSTLESVGRALTALGEHPKVEEGLLDVFRALLKAASAR